MGPRPSRRFILVSLAAMLVGSPGRVSAQATGTIRGTVISHELGAPVAHARIAIPVLGRELFARTDGSFVIGGIAPGSYRVVARFVGYAPGEATVRIEAGVQPAPVRIELRRLPVRLAAVRVNELRDCRNPGAPDPGVFTQLAIALEEMRENARRYRLLVTRHPYVYSVERTFSSTTRAGPGRTVRDTTEFEGDDGWRYAPGTLLIGNNTTLRLPDIGHFADSSFIATHCFAYAGLDTLAGDTVARIEFIPANAIRTPDVRGWIALDPETFRIKGSVFNLTNVRRVHRWVNELRVLTYFDEVADGLPVFKRVVGVTRNDPSFVGPKGMLATLEEQVRLDVIWRRGAPYDPP